MMSYPGPESNPNKRPYDPSTSQAQICPHCSRTFRPNGSVSYAASQICAWLSSRGDRPSDTSRFHVACMGIICRAVGEIVIDLKAGRVLPSDFGVNRADMCDPAKTGDPHVDRPDDEHDAGVNS